MQLIKKPSSLFTSPPSHPPKEQNWLVRTMGNLMSSPSRQTDHGLGVAILEAIKQSATGTDRTITELNSKIDSAITELNAKISELQAKMDDLGERLDGVRSCECSTNHRWTSMLPAGIGLPPPGPPASSISSPMTSSGSAGSSDSYGGRFGVQGTPQIGRPLGKHLQTISEINSERTCKVKTQQNSSFKPNGRNALAKCAYRYGFKDVKNGFICAPDGPKNKVIQMKKPGDMNGATEILTTDIALDLEYTVPVTVGTPGVKMNLDLDTGSSDFWCWSTEARVSAAAKSSHDLYDPTKSKTAKHAKGQTWKISYGDGSSASGDVFQDTVKIGSLVIDEMNVEVAKKLSDSFIQDVSSDGLMGMGWDSLNTVQPKQCPTVFSMMMPMLEKPLFTCNLTYGKEGQGFYTFGTIDESVTSEELVFCPVDNSQGFWSVPSQKWSVNGEEMQTSFKNAIVDTGTSLMLLDDSTCAKFYESIQGATLNEAQGGYTFPQNANLPEVCFYVGECKITMALETLGFGEPDSNGMVFGAIQSAGNLGFAIFGDSFIKNAYVCFNQGEAKLGVAQKGATA